MSIVTSLAGLIGGRLCQTTVVCLARRKGSAPLLVTSVRSAVSRTTGFPTGLSSGPARTGEVGKFFSAKDVDLSMLENEFWDSDDDMLRKSIYEAGGDESNGELSDMFLPDEERDFLKSSEQQASPPNKTN